MKDKRKMYYVGYDRTQWIIYKLFKHVWHMPKSIRDNFRFVERTEEQPYMGEPR